jgi:DNA-binding transcriptional LysR family regulator
MKAAGGHLERSLRRIRIIIPRTATQMVILPKLARLARTYPEIVLEVTSSNDPVDLVAGEYDPGVQLGEFIQRDMIAVRVTQRCDSRSSDRRSISSHAIFPENRKTSKIIPA